VVSVFHEVVPHTVSPIDVVILLEITPKSAPHNVIEAKPLVGAFIAYEKLRAGVLYEKALNRVPVELEMVAVGLIATAYCPAIAKHCSAVADSQLVVPHADEPIWTVGVRSIPPNPSPVMVKLLLPVFGALKVLCVRAGASYVKPR
jgi:hypothetical protein